MTELKHISLFTGVMGFDLGAEWAGIRTVATCEINPYRQQLIREKYEGRDCIHHGDIRTFNYNIHADIISAGFPCQDISIAARDKAAGINGTRSGLWKEVLRIRRENGQGYIVFENSPKILIRGFGHLVGALAEIGYMCEWDCLQNKHFGFPHERERIYIVAYPDSFGRSKEKIFNPVFSQPIPKTQGWEFSRAVGRALRGEDNGSLLRCDDGFPHVLDEIQGYGNSVNPWVAKWLFECIKKHRDQLL